MKLAMQKTRYFTFVRINPKPTDYIHLVNETKRIDANIYYTTDRNNANRVVLKGLLILRKQPTFAQDIARCFPNFLVSVIPNYFELDFWNLHSGVTIIGEHPYKSVQKLLFPTCCLSDFMKHEGPSHVSGNLVSTPEHNPSRN